MGKWFAQGGGRRERTVLATKVFGDMERKDASDPNQGRGLSARKIVRQCEASLKRMQTDWIDLYQMHHIDRACPFDEIWQAMETLVAQGKIVYAGSSNFAGWDIATAQQTAAHRHFLGLISEQSVYNLDNRTVELEVLPACQHYGLGVIPWSPLAGGLLGGALAKQAKGRRAGAGFRETRGGKTRQARKVRGAVHRTRRRPGRGRAGMAFAQPGGDGTDHRAAHDGTAHRSALKALEIKLSPETMTRLDEIWPGPGGEAPKAYSW